MCGFVVTVVNATGEGVTYGVISRKGIAVVQSPGCAPPFFEVPLAAIQWVWSTNNTRCSRVEMRMAWVMRMGADDAWGMGADDAHHK